MPGRAPCQPGCTCEKHTRARMSPDQARERQRERSRVYYQQNRERLLSEQQALRKDPVIGEEKRRRERERASNMSPEERERKAQLNRDWYRRNPRSRAENIKQHRKNRYGVTPERYEQMVIDQSSCCYLCGDQLDFEAPRKVHMDHDHGCCPRGKSCGECIRGLACEDCNHGIGHFRDDPSRMRRAADELEAAQKRIIR